MSDDLPVIDGRRQPRRPLFIAQQLSSRHAAPPRQRPIKAPSSPIISLPPQVLLAELAEEYVLAELCEALTLSLAAENAARMRAMTAAKSNVAKMLNDLIAGSRQLRQEEITNEIIELGGRKRMRKS